MLTPLESFNPSNPWQAVAVVASIVVGLPVYYCLRSLTGRRF